MQLSAMQWLGHEPWQLCLRAGFHYCKTLLSRVQMMLKLETDPSEILNELIYSCRKVLPAVCCAFCVSTKLYCADLCVHCHWPMGCVCLCRKTQGPRLVNHG